MDKYESLEFEIVELESQDVITGSSDIELDPIEI